MSRNYDMLSQVSYNESITAWRFRVKIYRVHSFYLENHGWCWSYVFVDEEGTKMEMTVHAADAERFREIEDKEGKCIKIFRYNVIQDYARFKISKTGFRLTPHANTTISITRHLNHHHYMEFVDIHQIPHIRNRNYPIDVMGVVFNFQAHFNDPAKAKVVFYIRDNIESEIKCVATGQQAYSFRDEFQNRRSGGEVIAVLKMWRIHRSLSFDEDDRWIQTEDGYSDFMFNPLLPEVAEFRQSILRSDPYVQRHGVIPP